MDLITSLRLAEALKMPPRRCVGYPRLIGCLSRILSTQRLRRIGAVVRFLGYFLLWHDRVGEMMIDCNKQIS
jgi:hypothetical protein